jgi:hypothetical protein
MWNAYNRGSVLHRDQRGREREREGLAEQESSVCEREGESSQVVDHVVHVD